MTSVSRQYAVRTWLALLEHFPSGTGQHVSAVVAAHAGALADVFYEQMLSDPLASAFLSHEQVKSRLHASLQRWVAHVFSVRGEAELDAVIEQQALVGDVHARIDVPVHLVLRGARGIKDQLATLLLADERLPLPQRVDAVRLMAGVIDLAMELMSQAYSNSHDRNSRASEAYRLFSVAQNLTTEKERQRAALLDWENQLMFDLAIGLSANQLPHIGSSEFGLWFRHKGAHAFGGTDEAELILGGMACIDEQLLPRFGTPADSPREERVLHLRELREQAKSIGYHLDRLFEQNTELEAGRDVLTRLLNRKFLPTVLAKEIDYARKVGNQFALLTIDIDHFKRINDGFGHESGDVILQQVAALLSNNSRGGDYLFRLGGEEFLLVLVDTTLSGASSTAEKLRAQVAGEQFRLPGEQTVCATISIGLSLYDGHPDYLRTLRRADDALYQAKRAGRNRVVVAAAE